MWPAFGQGSTSTFLRLFDFFFDSRFSLSLLFSLVWSRLRCRDLLLSCEFLSRFCFSRCCVFPGCPLGAVGSGRLYFFRGSNSSNEFRFWLKGVSLFGWSVCVGWTRCFCVGCWINGKWVFLALGRKPRSWRLRTRDSWIMKSHDFANDFSLKYAYALWITTLSTV